MQLSRRQVLRLVGVAAGAALAPLALTQRALGAVASRSLKRSMFTPRVGSTFRFVAPEGAYQAVLRQVNDLPHAPTRDNDRFGLVFAVRGSGPGQGTYTVRHPSLGAFPLFVVPVGGRGYYEAVVDSSPL